MNQATFMKVDKATFYQFVQDHDDQRFEFEDGYIVQQMTGGTLAHARIAMRLATLINAQLDEACWTALPDRGVETAQTIRYPDVVVEPVGAPSDSLSTREPAFVAEVLSPSSLARDLRRKPDEYTSLSSVQAYVVLSQNEAAGLVWLRQPDGGLPSEPQEIVESITVPGLNLKIALADVYRGINLPSKDPE